MKKPFLIISITLALVLGIVSCTSTPANTPNPATIPTPTPAPAPTKTQSITKKPLHIYEDGAIHVGGDREPIELINIPNAANPTYAGLLTFLKEDSTDEHPYIEGFTVISYVCSDFAEDVHNNAEAAGIRAAWVSIQFEGEEIGHALNAFETTDRGLVYVDCTGGNVGGVERLQELMKVSSDTVPSPQPTSWDSIAYVETGREYGLIYLDVASSLSYSFYEEYKWKSQEYDRLVSEHNNDVEQYNQEIMEKGLYEGSPEQTRINAWEARLDEKEKVVEELAKEYDRLMSDYNDDVEQYNQEIEGKVYDEGSSELAAIEAWEARLDEKEKIIAELAKEYDRLVSEQNNDVEQYNQEIMEKGILEGSSELAAIEAWEARLEEKEKIIAELAEELSDFSAKPLGIVSRIEIYW